MLHRNDAMRHARRKSESGRREEYSTVRSSYNNGTFEPLPIGGKIAVTRGKGHHTTQQGKRFGGRTLSSAAAPPGGEVEASIFEVTSVLAISLERRTVDCAAIDDEYSYDV